MKAPPPVAITRGGPSTSRGDHPPLAVAEMRFAEPLENLGDAEPGRRLDLRVGVDEGKAEPLRQPPPDRRLARAHQPDERDRLFRGLGASGMRRGLYRARRAGAKGRPCATDQFRPDPPPPFAGLPILLLLLLVLFVGFLVWLGLRSKEVPTSDDRAGRDQ